MSIVASYRSSWSRAFFKSQRALSAVSCSSSTLSSSSSTLAPNVVRSRENLWCSAWKKWRTDEAQSAASNVNSWSVWRDADLCSWWCYCQCKNKFPSPPLVFPSPRDSDLSAITPKIHMIMAILSSVCFINPCINTDLQIMKISRNSVTTWIETWFCV